MKRESLRFSLLICLVISLLVMAGCGQGDTNTSAVDNNPQTGGVLRYPLLDDPVSLDPAKFSDELSIDVGKEIFDGLVDLDSSTNKVIAAHAEKWDIKDNKVFTFHLRQGAKFHNGKEVTAEDFKYSFERLLDPQIASEVGWVLAGVKGAEDRMAGKAKDTVGIKVIDKYTMEITIESADPAFLSMMTSPVAVVVDKETLEKAQTGGKTFAATGAGPEVVVGTGPFKLSQWVPKNVIKLVRNEEYYGRKAYLDGVDFRIIPDETTTLNEFRAGNIDFTDRVPPGQAKVVEQEFSNQVIRNSLCQIEFYGLNTTLEPFNNVKIRQALNFAVDKEGIIKAVMEGIGVSAKGVLPPGLPEYSENLKGYAYDPAKAKALLTEAGFPEGKGLKEIELTYNNNRETNQKIAEAVQAQLKEIGVKVKLNGVPLPSFKDELFNGKLSFYRMGWVADYLDAGYFLNPLFRSEGEMNLSKYANPAVDKLLAEVQSVTDEQQRAKLYRQVEQMIVNDAPVLFLYHPGSIYLKGKNVNGIKGNPLDLIQLSNVWISK